MTAIHAQIGRIEAGLSFRAVQSLQKALAIPMETLASVLGMSRATLHRRKNEGKIDKGESERLVRYQRLLKKAENVFVSDGSYGVPKGLVSSFPLHSKGDGAFQIVPNVPLDEFATAKIAATIAELEKERDLVKDLLAPQ